MSTVQVHTPVGDYSGTVAGIQFVNGKAEVDESNETALSYFRRHGYPVGPVEETEGDGDDATPLEEYTVPELREYARQREIDLSGLNTKADILARIEAHPQNA